MLAQDPAGSVDGSGFDGQLEITVAQQAFWFRPNAAESL